MGQRGRQRGSVAAWMMGAGRSLAQAMGDGDAKGAASEGRWRFQVEICCLLCLRNRRVAMPRKEWNILV